MIQSFLKMKRIVITFFVALFFATTLSAQMVINFGKKPYYEAELILETGEVKKGYVKDFLMPDFIEFKGMGFQEFDFLGNKVVNEKFGADKITFKFKPDMDAAVEKIEGTDVSQITLIDKETFQYRIYKKLDVKKVNKKLSIVDGKDDLFLPLIKEGYLNSYGVVNVLVEGKKKYFQNIFLVMENPNLDFSINPIQFKMSDLFNITKLYEKCEVGMVELVKDCPEAVDIVREKMAIYKDKKKRKAAKKESIKELKVHQKQMKEKLKEVPRKERDDLEIKLWKEYYLKQYMQGMDELDDICGK